MVAIIPRYICLYVADVPRSVDFYEHILQLKHLPEQSAKHFTAFQFGSLILGIEPNGSASDTEKTKQQNATLLQFTVESMEELETFTKFLEQQQVRIIDRVRQYSFATLTSFLDPDGNRLEILYE